MIAAGSLVGFVLAFVLLAWALSAAAAGVVRSSRRRLAAAGPAAERRAAALALLAPPLLALAVVVSIGVTPFHRADHCEVHGHHLHLCMTHGAAWASQPFAVAIVTGVLAMLAIRAGSGIGALVRTRRAVQALARTGSHRRVAGIDVVVAPFERRLSFTAGVRTPRIFLSTAVWDRLDEDERAALLAHEVAHARGRDVLWGMVLAAAAALGAPGLARSLRQRWRAATERLRDRQAAEVVGDPALVGAALLAVARVPAAPAFAGALDATADGELTERVDALLANGGDGADGARRIARVVVPALVGLTLAQAVWSEPLHHALETVLAIL